MLFVVAYDISDDRRRSRVARELETWGNRTQFSVFECDLDHREVEEMIECVRELCVEGDALRVYRICQDCERNAIIVGGADLALDKDFYSV